jgi:hypothetical protein
MSRRDGEKTRATRARELRERVEEIVRGGEPRRKGESPRDFVHRRMREIAERGGESTSGPGRVPRRR